VSTVSHQQLGKNTINELAVELGDLLLQQGKYVSAAESCTGGGIAYAITEVAGSSQWFEKSWVTYSNTAKSDEVMVQPADLNKYGAVSQQVVCAMAQGARLKSHADISVAVSGIAGPGGATADKPLGLVWFAISDKDGTLHFSRCFSGDRHQVREQTIKLSLQKLIERLRQ